MRMPVIDFRVSPIPSWELPVSNRLLHRSLAIVLGALLLSLSACSSTPSSTVLSLPAQSGSYDLFAVSRKAEQAYQQSRFIEAVQLYQEIVERVPADADAWFKLGNTYVQQGAYERAIHAYQRSLSNEDEQPKAWFNLSTAYLLHAQHAMRNAHEKLRPQDPVRLLIQQRLLELEQVMHGRVEESTSTTGLR